jgi:hypothetical protein
LRLVGEMFLEAFILGSLIVSRTLLFLVPEAQVDRTARRLAPRPSHAPPRPAIPPWIAESQEVPRDIYREREIERERGATVLATSFRPPCLSLTKIRVVKDERQTRLGRLTMAQSSGFAF